MISLAPQQTDAVAAVRRWLEDPFAPGSSREPGVFRLFGYAGSGKTTIARDIAAAVGGGVRFACFTGKAAMVMHQKGCAGATTIHRLIYLPRIKCAQRLRDLATELRALQSSDAPDLDRLREVRKLHDDEKNNLARPAFTLNTESALRDAELLVIDECSMVGEQIGKDLLSFRVPILALGDPAQLPPVKDRGYFTDPRQPSDVLLTEIHRQAEGSDVLDLCTRARRQETLEYGQYGESAVVRRRELDIARAASFDQIIVGRNETRAAINHRVRAHLGRDATPLPVPGDRIVCHKNDYETGLLNGSQWTVHDVSVIDEDRLYLSISDGAAALTVEAHAGLFVGRDVPFYELKEAQCFEYAYAVTCHKAQGSQFPSVCVVDEADAFGPDAWRWRYTAISRASERVTVVR